MEKKYDNPPILNSIFFLHEGCYLWGNTKISDQPSKPDEVFPLKKPGCSSYNVLFIVKLKKKSND